MAAALALTLILGAVALVVNHARNQAALAYDHPADPLTDEQASAQVVEAAFDVTRAAQLRDPAGGYAFHSCTDATDPPYRATVDMTFALPQGNSVGYLNDVASAMTELGWTEAASPAEHFGRKLTRAGVTTVFYRNPERLDVATMRIYGECRVVTDHRADDPAWTELTDRLRQAK